MTTASGMCEVPSPRQFVWQALTAGTPYCPVCDVSYVFCEDVGDESGATMRLGTRFVCAPGRLDGGAPPQDAISGEIVEWVVQRCVGTRLELSRESWQTRIELADTEPGSTRVTVTITHQPKGGSRLLHALQRKALQRMVQRTVDSELAKLPDHIGQKTEDPGDSIPVAQGSMSVMREQGGLVICLRGEVDAPAVNRLGLQRRLEDQAVLAIDVRELTHIDSTAFPPLVRWAKRRSQAGGCAVIRGDNYYFDEMVAVMGLTSMFLRER